MFIRLKINSYTLAPACWLTFSNLYCPSLTTAVGFGDLVTDTPCALLSPRCLWWCRIVNASSSHLHKSLWGDVLPSGSSCHSYSPSDVSLQSDSVCILFFVCPSGKPKCFRCRFKSRWSLHNPTHHLLYIHHFLAVRSSWVEHKGWWVCKGWW